MFVTIAQAFPQKWWYLLCSNKPMQYFVFIFPFNYMNCYFALLVNLVLDVRYLKNNRTKGCGCKRIAQVKRPDIIGIYWMILVNSYHELHIT